MNEFTASNGIVVTLKRDGYLIATDESGMLYATGGPLGVDALREFFQHERDEALGRWRWPEDLDYVIYPEEDGDGWNVLKESTCYVQFFYPGDLGGIRGPFVEAMRAFLAAHPEPKPWDDAKPGEVWALTVEGDPDEHPAITRREDGLDWLSSGVPVRYSRVTTGRRIWPEAD